MAIKIQSLQDATANDAVKILVHGPSGAGKTVLCATSGMKTLMISAEAGLLSIRNAPVDMDVIEVTTIDDLVEVYELLEKDEHDYKHIALDSISEIAEVLLSEEKAIAKDARQAYGVLQDEITKILRKFRDLPYHITMVAKQQRFTDDYTGITTYIPAMPGTKLPQQVAYLFDEVFALRVMKDDEGADHRVIQTQRDISYEAKDRSGSLEMHEKAKLSHIFEKIQTGD